MTVERYSEGRTIPLTAASAYAGGKVLQVADGRGGVIPSAIESGGAAAVDVTGIIEVPKVASVVVLDGADIWWDHSAAAATPVPQFADRDFYLGTAVGDFAAGATTIYVAANNCRRPIIDLQRDAGATVPVLTSGTPYAYNRGGGLQFGFSATAEAQKLDWLSRRSFPITSNWIFESCVEIVTNADADVADLNVGVANETHASDADTIAESAFFHFDMGADANIDCEADDGTNEVAATDSTVDWAALTPLLLAIDGRDPSDLKFYINAVRVLSGTTFNISDGTGPLRLLLHFEKSSNDTLGTVLFHKASIRLMEQD